MEKFHCVEEQLPISEWQTLFWNIIYLCSYFGVENAEQETVKADNKLLCYVSIV